MPVLNFAPTLSFISAWGVAPLRPLHALVRHTEERFRPQQLRPHRSADLPVGAPASDRTAGDPAEAAVILREAGKGRLPTIVLGGLVPDATEQVFLLRRFLRKTGDVYYVQYPKDGFSLDRLCEQLSGLVAELGAEGQPPVVFAVSFGAGLVLEWLRRARLAHAEPALSGLVLVSPVTCVADIVAPGPAKPTTLLGRALRPYLDPEAAASEAAVEKSRLVFLRMFEAGAQNKLALKLLMSADETERLRKAVMATIRGVTRHGAQRRVQALAAMQAPTAYFSPTVLPLSRAPVLILFAEREDVVLDPAAPVRLALDGAAHAYFPQAVVGRVRGRRGGPPVQHASLIFHVFEFMPPLRTFYQRIRRDAFAMAA